MTVVLTVVNRFAAHNQSTQPVDNSGEKLGTAGGQPGGGRGERVKSRRRGCGYTQADQCQGPSCSHPLWTLDPGPTCDDGSCPHDPPHLLLRRCLLSQKSKTTTVGVSAVLASCRCWLRGPTGIKRGSGRASLARPASAYPRTRITTHRSGQEAASGENPG